MGRCGMFGTVERANPPLEPGCCCAADTPPTCACGFGPLCPLVTACGLGPPGCGCGVGAGAGNPGCLCGCIDAIRGPVGGAPRPPGGSGTPPELPGSVAMKSLISSVVGLPLFSIFARPAFSSISTTSMSCAASPSDKTNGSCGMGCPGLGGSMNFMRAVFLPNTLAIPMSCTLVGLTSSLVGSGGGAGGLRPKTFLSVIDRYGFAPVSTETVGKHDKMIATHTNHSGNVTRCFMLLIYTFKHRCQ